MKHFFCLISTLAFILMNSVLSQSSHSNRLLIDQKDQFGYIDFDGQLIVETKYKSAGHFSEGFAAVRKNGTFGFIDTLGNWVIPPKYDMAYAFKKGIAKVYLKGKPLFIDKKDQFLFRHDFKEIDRFKSNDLFHVTTHSDKEGVINKKGDLIIDTIYSEIGNFTNGLTIAKGVNYDAYSRNEEGTQIAVINTKGEIIVPFNTYRSISDFTNGCADVELNVPYQKGYYTDEGVIDTTGQLLFKIPGQKWTFDFLSDGSEALHEGKRTVIIFRNDPNTVDDPYDEENVARGIVNTKGEILFSNKNWKDITPFSGGRAFARTHDRKWYLIDSTGKELNEIPYSDVEFISDRYMYKSIFRNDVQFVEIKELWYGINRNGEIVTKGLDSCPRSYNGFIDNNIYKIIEQSADDNEHYWGLWNRNTNERIAPQFDWIYYIGNDDIFLYKRNDHFGYIDKKGKEIWSSTPKEKEEILPFNIDHMNRGYFYASSPYKKKYAGLGGWGKSKNMFDTISSNKTFIDDSLQIFVDESSENIYLNRYHGMTLHLANTTDETYLFSAQDSRLYLKIQAKDEDGNWKDIEYLPSSWCGNSYHTVYLPKGCKWSFTIPKYEGDLETVLRATLLYRKKSQDEEYVLYSNEFNGSVNPAQFWRKPAYTPSGLMDPYDD